MRISDANRDKDFPDTRCWCGEPGGCRMLLVPGPRGRLCEICVGAKHKRLRPPRTMDSTSHKGGARE